MRTVKGFTLLEFLVALVVIAVMASILLPNLLNAYTTAINRAARAYGESVYRAALAHVAEDHTHGLVVGDCREGYSAGLFSVPPPPTTAVQTCSVSDAGNGTPLVRVRSTRGMEYTFP